MNDALTPMLNMGQPLFEPPDVSGWALGPSWFTTGGMLSRLNFASQLATNQKVALRDLAKPFRARPSRSSDSCTDTLSLPPAAVAETQTLVTYVSSGGTWVGSDTQLLNKSAGLFHLLAGSGEYQFM